MQKVGTDDRLVRDGGLGVGCGMKRDCYVGTRSLKKYSFYQRE